MSASPAQRNEVCGFAQQFANYWNQFAGALRSEYGATAPDWAGATSKRELSRTAFEKGVAPERSATVQVAR